MITIVFRREVCWSESFAIVFTNPKVFLLQAIEAAATGYDIPLWTFESIAGHHGRYWLDFHGSRLEVGMMSEDSLGYLRICIDTSNGIHSVTDLFKLATFGLH